MNHFIFCLVYCLNALKSELYVLKFVLPIAGDPNDNFKNLWAEHCKIENLVVDKYFKQDLKTSITSL